MEIDFVPSSALKKFRSVGIGFEGKTRYGSLETCSARGQHLTTWCKSLLQKLPNDPPNVNRIQQESIVSEQTHVLSQLHVSHPFVPTFP